jgi:ketosteroid isomerase-like protein
MTVLCRWSRRITPRRMAVAVLVVFAAGCTPAEPPDTRAQDEAAIRTAETAWSAVINTKDVDKFVAYYAPDAVVLPPNMPMASTPDAIKKAIGEFMAMPGLSMTFQTSSAVVARSGDVGYTYGTYAMSANGPDGKPIQDKGKYVTVWKKQADGSWKAVVDTFNSDIPLTPPPPPPPPSKKK